MNSRVLTTIALCSATLTLLTAAAPATAAVNVQANQLKGSQTSATTETTKAFADIDLSQAKPTDRAGAFTNIGTVGTPKVEADENLNGGKVTTFDGKSGYTLPVSEDQYKKIDHGITLEAFFKYTGSTSGEHDILSNQEGGGVGLGVNNGKLTFFGSDGKYKEPNANVKMNKWVHAVGVIDLDKKKTSLYLNGKLVSQLDNNGTFKRAVNANHFMVGGDSATNINIVQSGMVGKVRSARIYDHSLSATEIQQLSDVARADIHDEKTVVQDFQTQLVGASDVVAGHNYNLNVHTKQLMSGDVDQIDYDVTFDPTKFEFDVADQTLNKDDTKVTQIDDKTLHVTSTAVLTTSEMRQYNQTRLARIRLKAKASQNDAKTTISVKNASASVAGKKVDQVKMAVDGEQSITIHAKDKRDLNGDGIIGIGDVALAPDNQKADVAKAAEIRPYKHVIVLTTDGGGNPWSRKGMYYAKDASTMPAWTTDSTILAKRKNTYTLDLFNDKFAMSTTAQAVHPTISAQNYSSMIHGLPWESMDKDYQMTNTIAGQKYFADFGKTQASEKYPSVFKVLQRAQPARNLAAFSEWAPFLNGIMEPDVAMEKENPAAFKSFDDLADYIGSDKFTDTSFIHMQSNQMDIEAHARGWYNDNYWNKYARYDGMFKTVMDKLEKTGHIHDTLVIANADHGGSKHAHGAIEGDKDLSKDPSNYNIFIALGGETIDSGRQLKGGSNADISALVLRALQVKQPASMTAKVFDESAFLDQTALVNKKRQVESITLERSADKVVLNFKAQGNRQIRTADTRIDLAGRSIDKIDVPEGAKILRQEVKDGQLKLTLSFNKQPGNTLANITLKPSKAKVETKVAIKEAMLGTNDGKEVLSDLINKDSQKDGNTKPVEPSKPNTDNTQKPKPVKPGKPDTSDIQKPKPIKPSKPDTSATQKPKPVEPSYTGNTNSVKPENLGNGQNVSSELNKVNGSHSGTEVNNAKDDALKKSQHKKNKFKGKVVYAQRKIGFYKSTKFTKKNRYKFFTAKAENKWAQFKIIKKKGNRYQVKDINKGSKTYGKTGYITANSKYVTSAWYTKKVAKVKVINPRGLSAYKNKTLKGKPTHYKKNTILKIKKIIKVKGQYHFQLKTGKYITADKHLIHAYY